MDIMATAARRRQGHSPVRRRPSSNSRRKRSPATPTRRSASKPGRPRTVTKHNQQNKIEIAKKGIRFGSLSHLLQSPTTLPNARRNPAFEQAASNLKLVGCDRQHHMPKRHRAALKLLLSSSCFQTHWLFDATATYCAHSNCTPGGVPASGSTNAVTIDHVIAGTAVLSDFRDHVARLMKRHERHGLRRGCEDQGKGSKCYQSDHFPCELHISRRPWLRRFPAP